jgi:hypothetical protein
MGYRKDTRIHQHHHFSITGNEGRGSFEYPFVPGVGRSHFTLPSHDALTDVTQSYAQLFLEASALSVLERDCLFSDRISEDGKTIRKRAFHQF